MRTTRWIALALLVAVVSPSAADAQDSTKKDAWLAAFSVGFPRIEGDMVPMLFTLGGNFTKIRPGALSPDFSIGTMPYALGFGVVPWATRAGLALPMQFNADILLLPSAGISTVGLIAPGAGDAVFGGNVGVALARRGGARMGITWHRIADTETIMLLEIGVGRLRE